MGVKHTYADLLIEHLHAGILETDFKKMCYLMDNCTVEKTWRGGPASIEFKAARASTVTKGGLAPEDEISKNKYVKGSVDAPSQWYGALVFEQEEILLNGEVDETNFLKALPDQLEDMLKVFKNLFSISVLGGEGVTKVTGAGAADGSITLANPERLEIGMKLSIAGIVAYVKQVDINTGDVLTVKTLANTDPSVDYSGLAAGDKPDLSTGVIGTVCYVDDNSEKFTSLRDHLLPAAGGFGGSDTIFGLDKSKFVWLQSKQYDGSGMTKANLLETLFDAVAHAQDRGAEPRTLIMSWKLYNEARKQLQKNGEAFKDITSEVTYAGFKKMKVAAIDADVELVAIREMPGDVIYGVDTKHFVFKSQPGSFFDVLKTPEGHQYYTVRNDKNTAGGGGYKYITDTKLSGQFVYDAIWNALVIHSIPATLP